VPDRFATLALEPGGVRVRALGMPLLFVDGQPVTEALLTPGQQVRLGRSTWSVGGRTGGAPGVFEFVKGLGDHLNSAAGIERPADWDPREMFADVAKKHDDDEIEAYFTVGTRSTTPALAAVNARWPRPWVFVRVFALSLALYAGFVFAWQEFENVNLIPGLIMVGSVAIPFSLLIFFFEMNVARNVSLYQVIRFVLVGGLVSIVASLFGFKWTGLGSWLGAASAGLIEETGKAIALLLVVRRRKYRWTLNGLLFGATVGTGFAVFESAGYALRAALVSGPDAMRETILERGLLSILGGHVLWTGLVGAALWRVRGDQPFRREMLADPRFLRVLAICMVMHAVWNAPFQLPLYGKYIVLGLAVWSLVLGFIQTGLNEIRDAQQEARGPATAEPAAQPAGA
jgi:RsiW-degrading membrane proteinase PrsW (M82 family)